MLAHDCFFFQSAVAMVSTPNNRTPRPYSAPIMSPLSPGEPIPSPVLSTLLRSDHHDSSAPKDQSCGDRKAGGQGQNHQPESSKDYNPRPKSTSEMKVRRGGGWDK